MTASIMKITIYIVKNTINDKIYIGQTNNSLKKRWSQGYRSCTYFNNALKKYGKDNFYFKEIEVCYNQETADFLEDKYIRHYNSRNSEYGYNLRPGGKVNSGWHHSDDTKDKISKSKKGKKLSESHKSKIKEMSPKGEAHPNYDKSPSIESIKKMSDIKKGKTASVETKMKMSRAQKGKKHTEETKKKISQSQPRTPCSEDKKKKLSQLRKGKHWKVIDGKRRWI